MGEKRLRGFGFGTDEQVMVWHLAHAELDQNAVLPQDYLPPRQTPSGGILTPQWSTRGSFPLESRVLRDQICAASGPHVNCVRQVDF